MLRTTLLCFGFVAYAAAQPASDLLQSAIYAQETAGDLDGAIRLYRQILSSSPAFRLYAGQAQYRLGLCLLRKGDIAAGTEALRTVVRDYPEEHELVARARESIPSGEILLPAPWPETEVAEYRWTIPDVDDGWSLTRIAPTTDKKNLRIQTNFYSPRLYTTLVDVNSSDMRPVHFTYRPPGELVRAGTSAVHQGTYRGPLRPSAASYEYGEVLYLLRRMPLYPGWSATVPVIAPNRMPLDLNASVTGVETVTVPAGTFKCYKVLLATDPKLSSPQYTAAGADWQVYGAGQWLWYGMDGARPLVKMQAAAFTGELTSLRSGDQMGTTSYRDPQVGFSFTVPSGWVFHARTAFAGPATSVDLLDPDFQVLVIISFKSKKTPAANIQEELMAGALQEQAARPALSKGLLETGQTGGNPSISWAGERDGPEGKVVRYTTWVQTENTRGSIAAAVPAADFPRFRERLQAILNSLRMP